MMSALAHDLTVSSTKSTKDTTVGIVHRGDTEDAEGAGATGRSPLQCSASALTATFLRARNYVGRGDRSTRSPSGSAIANWPILQPSISFCVIWPNTPPANSLAAERG